MLRKSFAIGLITLASIFGLCETGEAGHHHRRARHSGNTNCGTTQQSYAPMSSGCGCSSMVNYGSNNYGQASYGSNGYGSNGYGHSGVSGSNSAQVGQGYINSNVGSGMIGNGVSVGR